MATRRIRYLVPMKGAEGTTRWFWQPSQSLRKQGFQIVRLAPKDRTPWGKPPPGHVCDSADLWNDKLDAWRKGVGPHPFEDDRAANESSTQTGPAARRRSNKAGTLDALILRYRDSNQFNNLADSTKRMYRQNLDILSEWAGDMHVLELDVEMALEFYDELHEVTPTKANHVMTILRLLYSFARRRGKTERVPYNPFEKLGLEWKRSEPRIWTPEDIACFDRHAARLKLWSVGTAVVLNEWIGQREGDVLSLSRKVYSDGGLRFRQSKTGKEVYLPVDLVPKLARRLEEEAARWSDRNVLPTTLIASERTGRAYSVHAFGHVFREVRDAAAKERPDMADLWFMRLRHTAVVRLGEAGVNIPQIASITGHALSSANTILERYNIRTDKMARSAFQQRLDSELRDMGN